MAEQFRSISEARQTLPSLSQTVQGQADSFIITHQGKPQSVLLSYREYQRLRAVAQVLERPDVLEQIREGLLQLERGERFTPEQARQELERRRAVGSQPAAARKTAKKSIRKT